MMLESRRNGRRVSQIIDRFKSCVGAGAASMILTIPIVFLVVELAVFGGRVAGARGEVQSAARQAAREASFAAGPATAGGLASTVANASLSNVKVGATDGLFQCVSPTVGLGGATNFVAGGQVEVDVTCTVPFSDLTTLPVPGVLVVQRSAIEPIDPFRVIE